MKNILVDPLLEMDQYNNLINDIKNGVDTLNVSGVLEEGLGHFLYSIDENLPGGKLIVTYSDRRAQRIHEDLLNLGKKSTLFLNREDLFFETLSRDNKVSVSQINSMYKLAYKEEIVVSTYKSLLNKILSRTEFDNSFMELDLNSSINLDEMKIFLLNSGYDFVNKVELPGQFSIRGGILDIFVPVEDHPIRIELFDIEIDSIRTFDPVNQRSIENIDTFIITPASELLIDDKDRSDIYTSMIRDIKNSKGSDKVLDNLQNKLGNIAHRVNDGLSIGNINLIIPFIKKKLGSIVDYLPKDGLLVIDEPRRIETEVEEFQSKLESSIKDLVSMGEAVKTQSKVLHRYVDVIDTVDSHQVLTFSNVLRADRYFNPKKIYSFKTKTTTSYSGRIDIFKDELESYINRGYKVVILATDDQRIDNLSSTLDSLGISHSVDGSLKRSDIVLTSGALSQGIEYIDIRYVIMTHRQIYGEVKRPRRRRGDTEEPIDFSTIVEGDYVVHEDHGIGIYSGIDQVKISDVKRDYMVIGYKGADKLYIPTDQMNKVHKYTGSKNNNPKIYSLSSSSWQRVKSRVQKSLDDMTDELIQIYALRENTLGHSFGADTLWQSQFEDSFVYEETLGQIESIDEIKLDMESEKPMDRLLCADVGYGKTEVAMRAAFKAVMDNKQVAVLVPTTILAQQHYNTFVERFKDFPVGISQLSRFISPKEAKKTLEKLKSGRLDIVIGTHRLLSKDVEFNDLGLLIVDEEQRFGVRHKETIRMLKENVDTLTLTATPIPRTLQMSLMGIKDMSVIDEPPKERFPVQSYISEYNDAMIKEAIEREVDRDGQVFFVYNRVDTMDFMYNRLKELVPEVSIGVAHGQMAENQLEETFLDFLNRDYDLLLCTTIIETGLDIQNANTIIIYDADKFGLSQLYQLRGRVGRSNRVAYAYFTFRENKQLTEIAEKRLLAIREFTEFGSGFKIAMRDLEIRGAGNILGVEQHGQIEAIGYDMYMALLEDSMDKARGNIQLEKVETQMEINIAAYIPDNYIKDHLQKLEFYKKISLIKSENNYLDLYDEGVDRFGDMPEPVDNLLNISYIKSMASFKGISTIKGDSSQVTIEFEDPSIIDISSINQMIDKLGDKVHITMGTTNTILIRSNTVLEDLKIAVSTIKLVDEKN